MKNPLLLNSDVVKEEDLSSDLIVSGYQQEYNCDVKKYFTDLPSISIYRCEKTGFRFYYPFTTIGQEDFYSSLYSSYDEELYSSDKWEFKKALKYINDGSNVLDIGSGGGAFLMYLKKKKKVDIFALEKNNYAFALLQEKEIPCSNSDLEFFAENNTACFDVVTAFQVLEHVVNPGEFIESAVKMLRPNGILIIGVPNSDPYYLKHDVYHTLNLPPHHMGLWNSTSLKKISPYFGLKNLSIQIEPARNMLYYFCCMIGVKSSYLNLNKNEYWILKIFKGLLFPFRYIASGQGVLAVYQKDADRVNIK